LPESQVVVDERERLRIGERGVALHRVALHGFLHRAPAIEARARAALVPAFARVLVLIHGCRALGLELGKLELLPQPVDDLVELELDDEANLAVVRAAGLALLTAFFASGLEDVAGLAASLAGALVDLGFGEAQPRMLEEFDRYRHRAAARTGHQVGARQELGQRVLDRIADLLVMPQPVPGAPGEEVVPGRFGRDADHLLFLR
jgi:hypothetical protein